MNFIIGRFLSIQVDSGLIWNYQRNQLGRKYFHFIHLGIIVNDLNEPKKYIIKATIQ